MVTSRTKWGRLAVRILDSVLGCLWAFGDGDVWCEMGWSERKSLRGNLPARLIIMSTKPSKPSPISSLLRSLAPRRTSALPPFPTATSPTNNPQVPRKLVPRL